MIVPREEIGQIMAGELDELVVHHAPPALGAVLPLQRAVGKQATCYVKVLDTWPNTGSEQGGHTVRLKVDHKEILPRLLTRTTLGGYTTDPAYALQDETAGALDAATLNAFAGEAAHDFEKHVDNREAERREQWTLEDRMRRARELALVNGVDVSGEVRVIERRIATMERKIGKRAA